MRTNQNKTIYKLKEKSEGQEEMVEGSSVRGSCSNPHPPSGLCLSGSGMGQTQHFWIWPISWLRAPLLESLSYIGL